MPTRVFLCRHAETESWAQGRFCGRLEVGLSAAGVEQARALGGALAREGVTSVYSSPSRRGRETAGIVASVCGVDLVELSDLAEIDFGELDGLSYDEAKELFPDVYRSWFASPGTVRLPRGECLEDVRTRASRALAEVLEQSRGSTVAVVSHAGPLRVLLAQALMAPDEVLFRISLDHGTHSLVEWLDDGVPLIRRLNARSCGG
jgi:probable phosphoglycerate mutase